MIDIPALLDVYGIAYVVSGPNTARGNINVHCPFCGEADHSEHLGIKLSNGYWGCWRSKDHRGTNLSFLLIHLLGISSTKAKELLGEDTQVDEDALDAIATGGLYRMEQVSPEAKSGLLKSVLLPSNFKPLDTSRRGKTYIKYLEDRGFNNAEQFGRYYDLRYSLVAPYDWRIILPITVDDILVTFTSRHIGNSEFRYLSMPKEESALNIKHTLYNYDKALAGGRVLFVVEGPFDALKLDWYGKEKGCRAVGLHNMNMEEEQFLLLWEVVKYFEKVVVILDEGMEEEGKVIYDQIMPFIKEGDYFSLEGVKDPGELKKKGVRRLCNAV